MRLITAVASASICISMRRQVQCLQAYIVSTAGQSTLVHFAFTLSIATQRHAVSQHVGVFAVLDGRELPAPLSRAQQLRSSFHDSMGPRGASRCR
jgi:hypothetical protein